MTVLLAALDDSAAARPVVEASLRLAALLGDEVVAVHICENGSGATAAAIAESAGVPIVVRPAAGSVTDAIVAAQREVDAAAIAVGTRGLAGASRPLGHVALGVVQELPVPVLAVPPGGRDRPIDRVLLALEGDDESAAVGSLLERIGAGGGPELVALHVFPPEDLPPFGDHPVFETEAWAREFLRRTTGPPPHRLRLEVRVGSVVDVVAGSVEELGVDLVVLAWNQRLAAGHGRIVRRMLEAGRAPTLLLPADGRYPAQSGWSAA